MTGTLVVKGLNKAFLKTFQVSQENTCLGVSFTGLMTCNFIKNVICKANFLHIFSIPFFKDTCGRLLLKIADFHLNERFQKESGAQN